MLSWERSGTNNDTWPVSWFRFLFLQVLQIRTLLTWHSIQTGLNKLVVLSEVKIKETYPKTSAWVGKWPCDSFPPWSYLCLSDSNITCIGELFLGRVYSKFSNFKTQWDIGFCKWYCQPWRHIKGLIMLMATIHMNKWLQG